MGGVLRERIGATRPLPPAEELVLALTVAAGDVGATIESVLAEHELTPRQYHIMRMLRGAGVHGLPRGDIGRRLLARAPDVTRLMDQLVARAWVARVATPTDARVVLHRLTPAGGAILDRVSAPLMRCQARIRKSLGARSSKLLVELCEQLIEIVAAGSGARTA